MSEFRIGTRKSAMALAQTREVVARLQAAVPGLHALIHTREPRGDRDQVSRLDRHGGKGGAFVAEIRADVLAGRARAAMHSLKDMPGNEEVGDLVVAAYLPRDDPRDALVLHPDVREADVRTIGTNAVRRAALLPRHFPQAEIVHYRGAADTRIAKLDERRTQALPDGGEVGPVDAIVLAASGLERIGRADRIARRFSTSEMLPAVGQGIVAVECAAADFETRALLAKIDHADSRTCATAEREVLWVLDGHCNSPIAGHATTDGDTLELHAAVMSADGKTVLRAAASGPRAFPRELGRRVAFDLIEQGAPGLIAASETAHV